MLTKTALTASLAASLLALAACSGNGDEDSTYRTPEEGISMDTTPTGTKISPANPSVRGVEFELADGSTASMDDYKGRVVLVVNTASGCGLRPQVAELQTLYEKNKAKGFTVLAFPSASFDQEPLDSAGAAEYCESQGATYPVAAKADVKGESAHPLFSALAKQGGEPDWNYTKYLVGKDGRVIARSAPRTSPTSAEVQAAIDEALRG